MNRFKSLIRPDLCVLGVRIVMNETLHISELGTEWSNPLALRGLIHRSSVVWSKRSTLRWFGFRAGAARSKASSLRAFVSRLYVPWSKGPTLRAFDFRAGTARSKASSLRAFVSRLYVPWSKGPTLRAFVYCSSCLHMPIYIRVFFYQRKCSIICISYANSARLCCAYVSNARMLALFDQQLVISKNFDCIVVRFDHDRRCMRIDVSIQLCSNLLSHALLVNYPAVENSAKSSPACRAGTSR